MESEEKYPELTEAFEMRTIINQKNLQFVIVNSFLVDGWISQRQMQIASIFDAATMKKITNVISLVGRCKKEEKEACKNAK